VRFGRVSTRGNWRPAGFAAVAGLCLLPTGLLAGEKLPWASASVTVALPSGNQASLSMTLKRPAHSPVTFADLPGWDADDHLAAWKAFLASCKPVLDAKKSGDKSGETGTPQSLIDVCELALSAARDKGKFTRAQAKAFFESHFRPSRVEQAAHPGLLTGYYEPLMKGSRTPAKDFATPVYKRPTDLVNVVAESERGAKSHQLTHMRKTDKGLQPYLTRAEIEQGALRGQNLELLYFKDPVDVYFLQIQGSGRVELPDGSQIRITYDGKNGYPYTSVGKHLIEAGMFHPENMSLKALAGWLKQDRKRGEDVMWKNQSYVFFRELTGTEAEGAMGVLGIPLQPGRSLAVDTAYNAIGLPVYVSAPELTHATSSGGFQRLMIAHDVGSAIKGPERGDIFFGSGDKAGKTAGVTKHPGHFFVLEPIAAAANVAGKKP
jgi:membrane-bound lytic murein transglycosylase A